MNAKDRTQLLRNGYAIDAAGAIECHREPMERWQHTHLSSIRLSVADTKAAAPLIAAVIAAVSEEPGTVLIGTSKTSVLLVFKVGRAGYNVAHFDGGNVVHELVHDGKPGLFYATADAEVTEGFTRVTTAFDPGDYAWRENMSPTNTRRSDLAELWPDLSRRAYEAVGAFLHANGAGRWGPLVVPETAFEKSVREIAEKRAAGIVETPVDEFERTVAANPDLRPDDGIFGVIVSEARKRLAARAAARKAAAEQTT
jgi:hypothetical protein